MPRKAESIAQAVLNCLMPLISCVLEFVAIISVTSQHESICIQAREISVQAQTFLLLISIVVVPDLVFCLMVVLDLRSSIRPFGLLYQVCGAVICFWAAISLNNGITYCGNVAQYKFYSAVVLAFTAGAIHFAYIFIVFWQMPKILELLAVLLVLSNNQSICIQAREISFQADVFVLTFSQLIVPDFIFFILVASDSKISLRPLGFVYNIYATVMCIVGTLFLCSALTFCGNNAQLAFLMATIFGTFAACSHFGSIYEVGMRMPITEQFAMER